MMLQLILGRSGFGKTEYLRREFTRRAGEGDNRLLFLVPDQISFETETAFLDLLGPTLVRNICVVGFSRLCDVIFESTGNRSRRFADDGVRHVVMSMALDEAAPALTLFKKRSYAFDLCDLMLTAVKEYKKCAITPAMLYDAAERCQNPTLAEKLTETALVYETYDALMAQSFMDPLDRLTLAAQLLDTHELFGGYTIAVDAFYGFTTQEYEVLERLMKQADTMMVSLTDDLSHGTDTDLFRIPERTAARLTAIAKKNGVAIGHKDDFHEPYRFLGEELSAVEAGVFRYDKPICEAPCERVRLYRAMNIYDECDYVARQIKRLTEDGCRYRDIAVITRDVGAYDGVLDAALEKYDIRYFMNRPQFIDAYPLVRFVGEAFEIVVRGFERDDVLTLLKTGLCSYSTGQIAAFENYLYLWDISGKELFEPFTAHPRGFEESFTDEDTEQLRSIEAMRADVIGALRRFSRAVREATGREIAKALVNLLYAMHCDRNIDRLCDELEAQDQPNEAQDLIRIWNALMEILDKMVAVLGDRAVIPARFSELLYAYFSNTEISSIPRGIDEVDVATADRALISNKRVVFVIGAVDGIFPHTPVESGVFTDAEREQLSALELTMSDSLEELTLTEKYYVYRALSAARERLFVTTYACDLPGVPVTPSVFFSELCEILRALRVEDYALSGIGEHLFSEQAAFDYLIDRYHMHSDDIEALKAYFREREPFAPVIRSVDAAIRRGARRIDSRELALGLFRERMKLSASRVDSYYRCPFNYFCHYGLNVQERKRARLDALEYGTLMHYLLEQFFAAHRHDDFSSLDRDLIRAEVEGLLEGYAEQKLGGLSNKSERFVYLFRRISDTAVNLVQHICADFAQSDFVPVDFELGIGEDIPAYELPLEDGRSVVIRGAVDRVDRMTRDDGDYIRIVDYKTGVKEFNLYDILYGLNLQMLIYLSAIERNGRQRYSETIEPAGVLYMPAISPTVSVNTGADSEEIALERDREYAMKGVLIDDMDVVRSMEKDLCGRYIPYSINKGRVKGAASLVSLEEMGGIFRKIDALVRQMADALHNGEVDALPVKHNSKLYCDFCPYKAVCGRRPEDPIREARSIKRGEITRMLLGEEDQDGDAMDG